jgi:hypothetical protein
LFVSVQGQVWKRDIALIERLNDGDPLEPVVTADTAFERRLAIAEHVHREAEPRRHCVPVDDAILRRERAGTNPRPGRRPCAGIDIPKCS